jgi:hypothetical protein
MIIERRLRTLVARAPDATSGVLSSIPNGSEFSGPGLKNILPLYLACSRVSLLFTTLQLGHCRVVSCSRSVSDERAGFEDFLDQDLWFHDFLNYCP